jgi:hypothetical protein
VHDIGVLLVDLQLAGAALGGAHVSVASSLEDNAAKEPDS